MANTFKNYTSRTIGTSPVSVGSYTVGAGVQTTLIGLTVANILTSTIYVDIYLNDGTNNTYIVKNAPIPAGGTLVAVGGDQKICLETNDSIRVVSDTAASADCIMSCLEIS